MSLQPAVHTSHQSLRTSQPGSHSTRIGTRAWVVCRLGSEQSLRSTSDLRQAWNSWGLLAFDCSWYLSCRILWQSLVRAIWADLELSRPRVARTAQGDFRGGIRESESSSSRSSVSWSYSRTVSVMSHEWLSFWSATAFEGSFHLARLTNFPSLALHLFMQLIYPCCIHDHLWHQIHCQQSLCSMRCSIWAFQLTWRGLSCAFDS